jgi:hypothetical protein
MASSQANRASAPNLDRINSLLAGAPLEHEPHAANGHAGLRPTLTELPDVVLPGGSTSITSAAERLADLLSRTGKFFVRGGVVVRVGLDDDDQRKLSPVKPAAFCSDIEGVARPVKIVNTKDGEQITPVTCSETVARLILESQVLKESLPAIKVLSPCPVLIERGGRLVEVVGYDRASGILAAGAPLPHVELPDAVDLLYLVVRDFKFATPGDRARALAAIVTPALVFGGLLGGRAPIDLGEADQSQTGKGYRNQLTNAVYSTVGHVVTQRTGGGVGGVQESFDSALVSGACIISLDNFRGKLDCPGIESFLTERRYMARVPYSPPMEIDPTRTLLQLTSNRAEFPIDLANRSSCVRMLKQDAGYQFQAHPEGHLIKHVRANQPRFLAAVFAIVREWHRLGKQMLPAANHDFSDWARTLGYISEEILRSGDLLAGHRAAQERIASPGLNWLRDVALAVQRAGKLDSWLRASQILLIIVDHGVDTPGIDLGADIEDEAEFLKATRKIGIKLGRLLSGDQIRVEPFSIQRCQSIDTSYRQKTEYRIFLGNPQPPQPTPQPSLVNPAPPQPPQTLFSDG